MKRRQKIKINKTWTQKLSVLAISSFSVLFVINMTDSDNKSRQEQVVEVDQLTLESYIGFTHEFEDKLNGTDPRPIEVIFRVKLNESFFRVELSCEYNEALAPGYIKSEEEFKMVRVYRDSEGKSIRQIQKEDHVRDLNFADKKICYYWLEKLHQEIADQSPKITQGKLKHSYRVKFDKSSGLILDVSEHALAPRTKRN